MSETTTARGLADPAARRELMSGVEPEPGSVKPDPILNVDNIVRHFGGITAVDVDHLEVQRGIITALIGPNGAGKTTFFNLITGFDRPSSAGHPRQSPANGMTRSGSSSRSLMRAAWSRITLIGQVPSPIASAVAAAVASAIAASVAALKTRSK